VVLGVLVYRLSVWCGAVGYVSGLRDAATKVVGTYVEIKCQLDATDGSLFQNLLFAQHVSGTIMPIIRSSRVLYRWLLPVVLGAVKMKGVIYKLGSISVL